MIGQKRLLQKVSELKSLPHSILLLGERGSEQQGVCEFISNQFDLSMFDLSNFNMSELKQLCVDIQESFTPSLYIIDAAKFDDKNMKQNFLLKMFEEPSQYAYFIILCENESIVLDTIKTRSYILKLDNYSRNQLEHLVQDTENLNLILDVYHTPGQIELCNHCDITKLYNECMSLKSNISSFTAHKVIAYSEKINFKDEYDKYDLFLFTKMLKYVLRDSKLYTCISNLDAYLWSMADAVSGKQRYFEHFLLDLWEASKKVYN